MARLTRCFTLYCLLCVCGCTTTPQSRQILETKPASIPDAIELAQTPFFPQQKYQCGPAALATVLQSHRVDVTPETLVPQVYIPERQGSLQIEMKAAARRYGMLPYQLEPQLGNVLQEVSAGNPVLVMQNLGLDWFPKWHYAVVIGFDIDKNEMILRSGTSERWITKLEVFERTWQRADRWALAIVPVGEIPATAAITDYLETVLAFEQTGHNNQALKAYQAAIEKWPHDALSWITLGNSRYSSGNIKQAVAAFLKASEIDPTSTPAWNNLAYALHDYGCSSQAQDAIHCARRLAPDDKNLLDSENELSLLSKKKPSGICPEIKCQ